MLTVKRISDLQSEEAKQLFEIRNTVFVIEQHVDHDLEYDEHENEASHYLAYFGNRPCGAARWRFTESGIKLERFAVLAPFRSKDVGLALLDAILNDVIPLNKKIYLHAQMSAYGFYAKHGFMEEGDHFWEANIEHVTMVYKPE
ncbi:MAG: GNAT family N-acetyltransferase [Bacteroidia bacterium]